MNTVLLETAIAGTTSTVVATAVNADGLLTALIGFGTALITVVGGELIKFLVAFIKSKTKKYEEPTEEKATDDK